jgi:hypothetical protein
MAGVASLEVKAGAMGGGDRSGEDQYGMEKAMGYLYWRRWGRRRWFHGEPISPELKEVGRRSGQIGARARVTARIASYRQGRRRWRAFWARHSRGRARP